MHFFISEVEDNEPVDKDANIIDVEHIVKSPPEPTRVKSPEQMMMKSPEPVNWTVPLDTNRTFTVTQNIPEGKTGNKVRDKGSNFFCFHSNVFLLFLGDGYHHRLAGDMKPHHIQSHLVDNQDTSSMQIC